MTSTKKDTGSFDTNVTKLQLLEFTVGDGLYGINVAKVSDIIKYSQYPITPMPNSNPFVEGIFKPRDDTMTVINLAAYMGIPPSGDEEHDILIVTKLNNIKTAFHVHGVQSINEIPTTDIEKPDATIYGGEESMATGVAKFADKLITIIDFEKVLFDISPNLGFSDAVTERTGGRDSTLKPILIVEDSPLLERLILGALEKAGYVNIICTSNGQEAWDLLEEFKNRNEPMNELVSVIITDIEMPIMDGHSLTKLIKADVALRKIPVFAFSSIVTEDLREQGRKIGIVESVSKPEVAKLVSLIDEYIM